MKNPFKLLRAWIRRNRWERKEYERFITQCKVEQAKTRAERPLKMKMDIYDLQEGMLPKNYLKMHPKPTHKHHADFAWPKTKPK